jgi:hypothetical protein
VDAEAQMFDTTGIQENSNHVSPTPNGKYSPILHRYTLPPKKQRGVGGIDNGRSPRRATNKKYQRSGAAATAALTGVAVGGAVAYGVNRPTHEQDFGTIEAPY